MIKQTVKKDKRGGARVNAGRKKIDASKKKQIISVRLNAKMVKTIEELSNGNKSRFIEQALHEKIISTQMCFKI